MTERIDQLHSWMEIYEDEHLEFKEAKNRFDFEELVKYCCALANEGGGHVVLGVTDKRPRRVVGSKAFENLQRTKLGILERLRLRIDAWEVAHSDGRVLVFEVPGRPVGVPIQYNGAYWMRGGESLAPMTPDMLKRIFDESQPDFSAQPCDRAVLSDLTPAAVDDFRERWAARAKRPELIGLPRERLLADAELIVDGHVTYAALVLFGTHTALGRHLAQAEVVFEYRSDESSIGYQQRQEHRQGFFLFHDELWKTINLRNDLFSYQEGLFRCELRAFNENAVREAILNAVCHRDYRLQGSTFVRQFPHKLEIVSPGAFPPEITPETILFKQSPRNRRIAEALARCGLVERSGQGADRMFDAAIREGKLPPDFARSDAHQVAVTLDGKVQDEKLLLFFDRLGRERNALLHVDDLVVLDAIHRGRPIPSAVEHRTASLIDLGAVERVGRKKLVLSRRFYELKGRPGEYTRRRGLDRPAKRALLLQHIEAGSHEGVAFDELADVLPSDSKDQIKVLLRALKATGQVYAVGRTKAARWFPGPRSGGGHG